MGKGLELLHIVVLVPGRLAGNREFWKGWERARTEEELTLLRTDTTRL